VKQTDKQLRAILLLLGGITVAATAAIVAIIWIIWVSLKLIGVI